MSVFRTTQPTITIVTTIRSSCVGSFLTKSTLVNMMAGSDRGDVFLICIELILLRARKWHFFAAFVHPSPTKLPTMVLMTPRTAP